MSNKSNRPLERLLKVLEVVIEQTKENPNQDIFRISVTDFLNKDKVFVDQEHLEITFQDINEDTGNEGFIFLETELIETDYIKTASGVGDGPGGYITVKTRVKNKGGLNEYYNQKKKSLTSGLSETKGEITSLVLIAQPNTKDLKVAVNGDEENLLDVGGDSWNKLFEIANKQNIPSFGNKGVRTYFNSSKLNPLRTAGYLQTKIIKTENGQLLPNIPIKTRRPRGRKKTT